MQIDHIALYTRDLERLCEFYTKYFDGTAGKLYQNEETGTQACFVSFADGARLEIVTRPQFEDAEHSTRTYPCRWRETGSVRSSLSVKPS